MFGKAAAGRTPIPLCSDIDLDDGNLNNESQAPLISRVLADLCRPPGKERDSRSFSGIASLARYYTTHFAIDLPGESRRMTSMV